MIRVENVTKIYRKKKRFFQKKEEKPVLAVDNISFSIEPGEFVGFIGPNGAGKSTTIKMMCGILYPTSGDITVLNKNPFKKRKEVAQDMGVLFGQKSQLWWDLPVYETMNLHRNLYGIQSDTYKKRVDSLKEVLGLDEIWNKTIRKMSLGQRMRCELAVSLVHSPKILFLDEPTIGMDILVKENIREFLIRENREHGTTIILTSHDVEEIVKSCRRAIVINEGKLVFDDTTEALRTFSEMDTRVTARIDAPLPEEFKLRLKDYEEKDGGLIQFFLNRTHNEMSLISELYQKTVVSDLRIEDPPIETVIRSLYEKKQVTL